MIDIGAIVRVTGKEFDKSYPDSDVIIVRNMLNRNKHSGKLFITYFACDDPEIYDYLKGYL